MKISVVIPAYNEEKYIGKTIAALQNQTRPIDEIIVVDNNCVDGTVQIAYSFGVKVIAEKRQGMIAARNAGFNHAQGDIIIKVDADTIVAIDWAEKVEQNFSDSDIVGLVGSLKFSDSRFYGVMNFSYFYVKVMRLLSRNNTLMGPSMAIRASVWEKVKDHVCLDDKQVHEDIDLALNVGQYGKIKHDRRWRVETSARRMVANPGSFFIEYPIRTYKTFRLNRLKRKLNSGNPYGHGA